MIICTFKPEVKMIDAYNLSKKLGYELKRIVKDGKIIAAMVK